jgi:hypothetical protein
VRADEVSFDARTNALEAKGVRVDVPPFHLSSEQVQLRKTPIGVELDGQGRLAFCPCLGNPLAISFKGATVAPPHDVILRSPRLEIFGLPVLWSPIFWLRSSARPGVLPPEIAYRGKDGLFAGGGVHVPMKSGDGSEVLDLRAGAYFKGGVAVDARLRTVNTATRVRWDHLEEGGLLVDARGSTRGLAWDADMNRGARAWRCSRYGDARRPRRRP